MNILGRILIVLGDIVITPVTVPLVLVGQFVACAFFALRYEDSDWITRHYLQIVRETFSGTIKQHIEFLKTGYITM